MAMYVYGLHAETRQFTVRGPFDTEGARQREAGFLLEEGTVTLKTRDRVQAERQLKQLADSGKLRGFEQNSHQKAFEGEESSLSEGFFPKLKRWLKGEKGENKSQEDDWERN